MSILLASIVVDGVTYNVSKKGYAGFNFFYPYVVRMPTLELGEVSDSGKLGVRFGFITLTNEPNNPEHPFGVDRFRELVEDQSLYDISIKWGEDGDPLFEGEIYLQSLTDKELSFGLTDKSYILGARPFSLTESFVFVESVTLPSITGQPISIGASNHNFSTGQVVIFEQMDSIGEGLEYVAPAYNNPATDNFYVISEVTGANSFSVQTKDGFAVSELPGSTFGSIVPNGITHRVGIPTRVPFTWGIFEHKTPVLKKAQNEIANPLVVLNDTNYPVEVREDGVLIYTTDPTSTEYWGAAIQRSGNYTQLGGTDLIISDNGHGRSQGDTVSITFSTGSLSGTSLYTVDSVGSSSEFTVTNYQSGTFSGTCIYQAGRQPTAETIFLNRKTVDGSILSISGKSLRGATLQEFFQYVATSFGFTLDDTLTSTS